MSGHWGEFEDPEKDEDPSKIILAVTQGKFRNGFSNFDLPSLHQPSANSSNNNNRGPKKE